MCNVFIYGCGPRLLAANRFHVWIVPLISSLVPNSSTAVAEALGMFLWYVAIAVLLLTMVSTISWSTIACTVIVVVPIGSKGPVAGDTTIQGASRAFVVQSIVMRAVPPSTLTPN